MCGADGVLGVCACTGPGADVGVADGSATDAAGTDASLACRPTDKLDLVLVIDNSGSMAEEQASLRAQLPAFMAALTSGDPTPSMPGSGDEFSPVRDVHVGIVTTDAGSAGYAVRTCETMLGDDGLFATPVANMPGRRIDPGALTPPLTNCPTLPTTPPFLAFTVGQDAARFANDFACLANVGTRGCGFEQQLEMPLKALWPPPGVSANPPDGLGATRPFALDTQGHGQNEHAGFLRTDSVLAVLIVSDEEDCSVRDTGVFDESNAQFASVDLNLRCGTSAIGGFQGTVAHSTNRYVQAFRALRAARPQQLVFAAIVGVPPTAAALTPSASNPRPGEGRSNLQSILAEPLMQEAIRTGDPSWTCTVDADCSAYGLNLRCTTGQCVPRAPQLRPSCNTARGIATPPRRIVTVARELDGLVQSICQEDFAPAVRAITRRIARAIACE